MNKTRKLKEKLILLSALLIYIISFFWSSNFFSAYLHIIIVIVFINFAYLSICLLIFFRFRITMFFVLKALNILILLVLSVSLLFSANLFLELSIKHLAVTSTLIYGIILYATIIYTSSNYVKFGLKGAIFHKDHLYITLLNAVLVLLLIMFLPVISSIKRYIGLTVLLFVLWLYLTAIILYNHKTIKKENFSQWALVFGYISLFWDIAAISPFTQKCSFLSLLFMVTGLIIFNSTFLIFLYMFIKEKKKSSAKKNIPQLFLDNPVILTIIAYLSLSMIDIKVNPIFDSALYFWKISIIPPQFDFVPQSSFILMQVMSHTSGAFSSYYLLGQFLSPFNNILANIQSHIMMVFAIFAFERILNYFYSGSQYKWQRMLGAAIFAFTPTIYGSTLQMTTDFFIGAFLILTIASILYKKNILAIFFSIMMIYSKTPGIVMYIAFVIGIAVLDGLGSNGLSAKKLAIKSITETIYHYSHYLVPVCAFAVWYIIMQNNVWGTGTAISAISGLGLKTSNFYDIFMQLFVINFNWVIFSLIISTVLVIIRRVLLYKSLTINTDKLSWISIIIIAFIGYALFNILFTATYNHARYIIPCYMLTAIFTFFAVNTVSRKTYSQNIMLSLIFILTITSAFNTFDPLFLRAFPKLQSEKQIYSLFDSSSNAQNGHMSDIALYNREYVYIDKLWVDFLNETNFGDDDIALFIDINPWNLQYNGNSTYFSYVRSENGRKITEYDPENALKAAFVLSENIENTDLPQEAYLIRPWYQNESMLQKISLKYNIIQHFNINKGKYELHAYKIVLKK